MAEVPSVDISDVTATDITVVPSAKIDDVSSTDIDEEVTATHMAEVPFIDAETIDTDIADVPVVNVPQRTASNSFIKPVKVSHQGTLYVTFRLYAPMCLGQVHTFKDNFKLVACPNSIMKFYMKKITPSTVAFFVEKRFDAELCHPSTFPNWAASQEDDGYFLRLYISVIGVHEKPKMVIMGSNGMSSLAEFKETEFLHPREHPPPSYTVKCVFRMIETTILSNAFRREMELFCRVCVGKFRISASQDADIGYLLGRSNPMEFITGRKTPFSSECCDIIGRAYGISQKLVHYFTGENYQSVKLYDLALILGHLYFGTRTVIQLDECRQLYLISAYEGLTFVRSLCTHYIVASLEDDCVLEALLLADMTEDSELFNSCMRHVETTRHNVFITDKWKRNAGIQFQNCASLIHGFYLRRFTDCSGFPPDLAQENGQP